MKEGIHLDWNTSPVFEPPRSRLYRLVPIGLGTPMVECLSSYIHRLAWAHGLPTWVLVCREIAPRFRRQSILTANGHCDLFGRVGMTINGNNGTAREAIAVLKILTGQPLLRSLSFCGLGGLVAEHRILRGTQAWCPRCMNVWREDGRPIYQPLIWTLSALEICPEHVCRLSDRCFSCGKRIPALGRYRWDGQCPKCSEWLGSLDGQDRTRIGTMNPKCGDGMEPVPTNVRGDKHVAEPAPTKAWRIEDGVKHLPAESFLKRLPQGDDQHDGGPPSACDAFTARALSRLVEGMQSLRDGTQRGVFSSNVMDLVRDRFGGNVSAFARAVEVHRSTASDWATGTRQPSIESLVGLAQRFGGELLDWINGRITWSANNSPPPIEEGKRSKTRRPLRRYPPAIVQAHLTCALVAPEDPSPSFGAICRRLGVSQTVAKRLFPDLAGELMGRYSVCRAERKRVRESLLRSAVESAVERLIADGRALSYNQLYEVLPPGVSARDRLVRMEFRKLREQLVLS